MGQQAAHEAEISTVDRCGLSEEEYGRLKKRLRVTDEKACRVELADFVACFPSHLRPFVQPIFFYVSKERVGEGSAAWKPLASGLAEAMKDTGLGWSQLLQVWRETHLPQDSEPDASGTSEHELGLFLELALTLCFWSAFSDHSPNPAQQDEGQEQAVPFNPDQMVAVTTAAAQLASLESLARWLQDNLPMLPRAVGANLAATLVGREAPPAIPGLESRILSASLQLLLRASDARLWESEDWLPLYRDWCDGMSFNALVKGAAFYEGPALVLIRTSKDFVLGALSTSWVEGNGKFGGSMECFLFALQPAFGICKSSSRTGNYVYFNSRNKHHPRGLGFGGQEGFCRLWLDADFEDCYVLESDATYTAGRLLPAEGGLQTRFDVINVEVWGCGGVEAAKAQAAQRERLETAREQARKVDKARLCDNEFDKEMLLANTFSATAGSREPNPKEDESTS